MIFGALTCVVLAYLVSGCCSLSNTLFEIKPIEKFVEDQGYVLETHQIITEDGYNLTYHRIPRGKAGSTNHGHPVLLAHGFLQSSAVFLAMKHGLAYLLADAGFDVWMTNARGNTYSRKHIERNPDKSIKFWEFSFDEVGRFDLPAAIDYITSTTEKETLSYVGFSLGSTSFWVLASTREPKYMRKVTTMIALAPIARPSSSTFVKNYGTYMSLSMALKSFEVLNLLELRPFNKPSGLMMKAACADAQSNPICRRLLSTPIGLFPDTIHYDNALLATQYLPAGSSVRTLQHFLQLGTSGKFEEYDYEDKALNIKHYGSSIPPEYDLGKVTCPVYLVYSEKDSVSVKEDTLWLSKRLPQTPGVLFLDDIKDFKHNDYFYSPNVDKVLYEPLVRFLNKRVSRDND